MSLHADVGIEAPRQVGYGIEIEFVFFIAIGIRVFLGEVKQVGVPERKRVALVGVVVEILGVGVIGVEEEAVAHALTQTNGGSAVERLSGANGVGDVAEVRKNAVNVGVGDGV